MAPRERRFSARDGLPLFARDWEGPPRGHGSAVPLFCLSGIARSSLDYLRIAERYRGTRRVVALDYAGHGESGRAPDPRRYLPERTVTDVLDAMAALGLHRVALLGTSLGGILGMALGTLRPGVLAGLALNDIGPSLAGGGLDPIRDLIGRDPGLRTVEEATAFLQARLPPLGIPADGWADRVERTYARDADGWLRPRWDIRIAQVLPNGGAPAPELWPFFHALPPVPLLLVWGQASRLLSEATVRRMQAAQPRLAVCPLPGIGHAPTLADAPALAALDAWLDGIG